MMRKKVFRVGAMLVLCLIMVLGTATSAFAYEKSLIVASNKQ